MKKQTGKKILILLITLTLLMGIAGIADKSLAADPKGTCWYEDKYGARDKAEQQTSAECARYPTVLNVLYPDKAPFKLTSPQWVAYGPNNPDPSKSTLDCTREPDKSTAICRTLANCQPPKIVKNNQCVDPPRTQTPINVKPGLPYTLLAPIPCEGSNCDAGGTFSSFDPVGPNALGKYLNILIRTFLGICAVLAVIMIVIGGLEYMTTELISSKESAKSRITHAIVGLLLALLAWTILNQINPNLLNTDFSSLRTAVVMVDLGGESSTPFQPINASSLKSLGISCNNSGGTQALTGIAQSFVGRSTYSQTARNTTNSSTAFVDCSSFVSQVYVCAGLPNPGGTTAGIFGAGRTPVTSISADGTKVNGQALKVGDLLGWRQGENGEKWGHVVMYIGNGQVIDAQRAGVAPRSLNSPQFKGRIKYIKPI